MIKVENDKYIISLTRDEFFTIMIQLDNPCIHKAGIDDSIIHDLYKESKKLYNKLDKEFRDDNN